jgi:hypothetical protein
MPSGKAGGHGAPNPYGIYSKLVEDVLTVLDDEPVMTREYRQGAEAARNSNSSNSPSATT